ncbi:ABC transporter substrate-binding protein [Pseudoleptotrichia goodfellowii]|uniref:ABC transporter substrate binding protein n=1 Tax=Pseudoleptotrichia goodfellowii F0264 TaxID=596323 RepID=D0GK27_9FUSO|nr:ABC transporter substrate-binding protein [Pseudoleptotrichia goodfellowii]EEY35548.1 ABC transporter substrate binding protein [Pseudoleptotrichia goodfellowii F0264]
MKRLLLLVLGCLMILACGKQEEIKEKKNNNKSEGKTYKIGITQIVTHPSLDMVKEGFKKAFEEAGMKADFDETNAEGSIPNANLIANKFKSDKKDLILGIATPSAQALANSITDIPILFSAVTDPVSAKILNKNVTGTSDKLDNVGEQLDLLIKLKPETKKIGVLYNPSEQNSLVQVKEIQEKAKERNLTVELQGITSFNEVAQATKILLGKTDALYLPTDNLVVSAVKLIVSEGISAKKPVISSERSSVDQGALFTMGLNYFDLGKRTGEMAIEILKGKPASEIPFETSKKTTLFLNEKTAQAIGIDIKNPVLEGAEIVK